MDFNRYIFVYGSLRDGGTNQIKTKSLRKIGVGITADKYSFISAISRAYPYASHFSFDGIDKVNVTGELYEVSEPSYFLELDKLEYNYIREIVTVIVNCVRYETNMYLIADSDLIYGIQQNLYPNGRKRFCAIESGDWFKPMKISNGTAT